MAENLFDLKKQIEQLDQIHHPEILKIFEKHNIQLSENKNGTFINIINLPEQASNDIRKFIDYIHVQEKSLGEVEDKKEGFKKNYFT